jgi:hypothetical protein
LNCLLDFASQGSWLKVTLGKLGTERTVLGAAQDRQPVPREEGSVRPSTAAIRSRS